MGDLYSRSRKGYLAVPSAVLILIKVVFPGKKPNDWSIQKSVLIQSNVSRYAFECFCKSSLV